jgi:hypothetical protein
MKTYNTRFLRPDVYTKNVMRPSDILSFKRTRVISTGCRLSIFIHVLPEFSQRGRMIIALVCDASLLASVAFRSTVITFRLVLSARLARSWLPVATIGVPSLE